MKTIIPDAKHSLFNSTENCNETVPFSPNLRLTRFFPVMYIKVIWGASRSSWNMELMVRCAWQEDGRQLTVLLNMAAWQYCRLLLKMGLA